MKRAQTDRVIFNGHDLSALVSCKVNRPIMAPVNANFESVSGRHGELFKSAYFGGYDLPVDIWLRSDDRRRFATHWRNCYAPTNPRRWCFPMTPRATFWQS